jgi:hypothetical protein
MTEREWESSSDQCRLCSALSPPLRYVDDVTVAVNWAELRILATWAALHADVHGWAEMSRVISAICGRLQAQHPQRPPLVARSKEQH